MHIKYILAHIQMNINELLVIVLALQIYLLHI